MARNTLIQIRRGSSAEWAAANEGLSSVLSAGEWGLDTTLGRYKIGDGSTVWNDLPWASIRPVSEDIVGSGGAQVDLSCCGSGSPLVTISVSGIPSSKVTDFSSAVSGLLPSLTGVSGVDVNFNSADNKYTISLLSPEVNVTGIVGFVDAVNDRVGGLLTAGSNIELTYVDSGDETSSLTIAVTGVSLEGHTHIHSDITDFTEAVQDVVGTDAGSTGFLRNGSGISWTYNDGADTLTVGVTGIPSSLITDFASAVSDQVDTTLVEGTGIGLSYNGGTNELTVSVTGISNTLVQGLGTMSTQNSDSVSITNGNINVSGLTVNSTGVSLSGHIHTSSDITDFNESVDDRVANLLTGAGAPDNGAYDGNIVFSYEDDDAFNDQLYVGLRRDLTGINSIASSGTGSEPFIIKASTVTATGNLVVGGDLVVHGTSTTVNSTVVDIGDNIITVNTSGLSEGGFRVFEGSGGNYQSLIWNNTLSQWEFSGPKIVATGTMTADQFVGGGGGLTNLNATSISTGTLDSARLPSVSQTNTTNGPSGTFVSSVSVDSYGRVTGVNSTTHTLATTSVVGIASFDSGDFTVNAGSVAIKTSGVSNSQLENSSITVGQTPLVLGNTYSAISGVSAASPVVLTYFSIDGGTP